MGLWWVNQKTLGAKTDKIINIVPLDIRRYTNFLKEVKHMTYLQNIRALLKMIPMKINTPSSYLVLGIGIVTGASIISYLIQFGFGFWDDNEDWGYLGSFFGGVLGPLFSFASFYLLLLTLKETKSSNDAQLAHMETQLFEDRFFNTMNIIKLSLESKVNILENSNQKNGFYSEANSWVCENFHIDKHTDIYEDAWNNAKNYIRKKSDIFSQEAALLTPIMLRISDTSEQQREQYMLLIQGYLSNDQRFWLAVYADVYFPYLNYALKNIINFYSYPDEIVQHILSMEESR
ncbi:hypothetical protein ACET9I_03165 [Aeromonas veronii]